MSLIPDAIARMISVEWMSSVIPGAREGPESTTNGWLGVWQAENKIIPNHAPCLRPRMQKRPVYHRCQEQRIA